MLKANFNYRFLFFENMDLENILTTLPTLTRAMLLEHLMTGSICSLKTYWFYESYFKIGFSLLLPTPQFLLGPVKPFIDLMLTLQGCQNMITKQYVCLLS